MLIVNLKLIPKSEKHSRVLGSVSDSEKHSRVYINLYLLKWKVDSSRISVECWSWFLSFRHPWQQKNWISLSIFEILRS